MNLCKLGPRIWKSTNLIDDVDKKPNSAFLFFFFFLPNQSVSRPICDNQDFDVDTSDTNAMIMKLPWGSNYDNNYGLRSLEY